MDSNDVLYVRRYCTIDKRYINRGKSKDRPHRTYSNMSLFVSFVFSLLACHRSRWLAKLPTLVFCCHGSEACVKGQCNEIFDFRFSTWISFPQAPDYNIRAVLIFFERSLRYSQLKVLHRCGVVVTGGKWKNLQSEVELAYMSINLFFQVPQSDIGPIVCHRCHWHRCQICRWCRWYQCHFATGINNTSGTCGKICRQCHWYRWCTLTCEYLQEFRNIFRYCPFK